MLPDALGLRSRAAGGRAPLSRLSLVGDPSLDEGRKRLKRAPLSSSYVPGTMLEVLCASFSSPGPHNSFVKKLRPRKTELEPKVTLLGGGGSEIQIQAI